MTEFSMAEHNNDLGHHIWLNNLSILAKKSRHRGWLMGKVTKIKLHPNNINSEDRFSLIRSWRPLIYSLKERKKILSSYMILLYLGPSWNKEGRFCHSLPTGALKRNIIFPFSSLNFSRANSIRLFHFPTLTINQYASQKGHFCQFNSSGQKQVPFLHVLFLGLMTILL
jgi:hypothetical protein